MKASDLPAQTAYAHRKLLGDGCLARLRDRAAYGVNASASRSGCSQTR